MFVAQAGVRNMHMASSSMPLSTVNQIRAIPGVTSADPILYRPANLNTDAGTQLAYLIGYRDGAIGGPIALEEGSLPGPGEIVLDDRSAGGLGVVSESRSWRSEGRGRSPE